MKKYILPFITVLALLGCKDNPVSKKITETTRAVSNTSNAVSEMNKMQDDIKELAQLTPMTNEQMRDWLPEEINGMKRISYKAGEVSMMGVASIEGNYANEDKTKQFGINVIDGAGESGAALTASMRMMMTQVFEEEDEYKKRRTVNRNGNKAIEEFQKDNTHTTIQFLENNRFYIEAKGDNMDLDETWDAIDKLKLNKLG